MTAQRPVAIVTGGSAGIGWEIGRRLSADGYRVVATDRVPGLTAGDDADGILWRELDVTDHAAVDRVFGEIEAELGPIEVLVNNAGLGTVGAGVVKILQAHGAMIAARAPSGSLAPAPGTYVLEKA